MKDGKMIRTGDRYEIVYSIGICSLEVAACEMRDAGKYTCIAENSQGTEESTCKVTVNGMRSAFSSLSTNVCLNTGFSRWGEGVECPFHFLSL